MSQIARRGLLARCGSALLIQHIAEFGSDYHGNPELLDKPRCMGCNHAAVVQGGEKDRQQCSELPELFGDVLIRCAQPRPEFIRAGALMRSNI